MAHTTTRSIVYIIVYASPQTGANVAGVHDTEAGAISEARTLVANSFDAWEAVDRRGRSWKSKGGRFVSVQMRKVTSAPSITCHDCGASAGIRPGVVCCVHAVDSVLRAAGIPPVMFDALADYVNAADDETPDAY